MMLTFALLLISCHKLPGPMPSKERHYSYLQLIFMKNDIINNSCENDGDR